MCVYIYIYLSISASPPARGPTRHCCAPCQRTFASYQAWSVHAFKSHGLVGEYRRVLTGLQCQACLRHFTTHVKLCRHLQHFPSCRHFLQARGYQCHPEPGIGNRKVVDEGNFQAPSLQAEGPALPPPAASWDGYLDRPPIEVLECLTHIPHDLPSEEITAKLVWERGHLAFSSVCLPNRKIAATARVWEENVLASAKGDEDSIKPVCDVARWLSSEDRVDWLVPRPEGPQTSVCTFRDARQLLPLLDVSGVRIPVGHQPEVPVYVRVGSHEWISRHSKDFPSAVDFSHQECLDTFEAGGSPSFFEDISKGVVFVLSIVGLPTWTGMPSLPTKRRSLISQLAKASLASDLLRLALRLWPQGVPTAFLCPAGLDFVPASLTAIPGLTCSRLGDVLVWRSSRL